MLGKLIKNEFKATIRTFGVMYLVVFMVTVALKLFVEIQNIFKIDNVVIDILSFVIVTAFILGIIGIVIGTFILILKRFYDSMLKSEGYLTFTLPATVGQHIASKSIVSYIWFIASAAFIFVILMVLCLGDSSFFVAMRDGIKDIVKFLNEQHLWKYAIEMILVLAIAVYNYIAVGYACFSVGQAWTKSKVAGALVTYIVFNIITEIIASIAMVVMFGNIDMANEVNIGDTFFEPLMIFLIVEQLIVSILCTVVTRVMLSRKLNLE